MTQSAPQQLPHLQIPATPREVSRRAAARAWAEMSVQMWWKSALAVLLVAGYVTYMQGSEALRKRSLLERGVPVKTVIVEVAQTRRLNYALPREDSIPVKLRGLMPGSIAEETEIAVRLPPGPGFAKVGEPLAIRIDPKNPKNWAEDVKVEPWWQVLALPLLLLLPVVLLLLGVAWWQRRRVLEVWREGRRLEAVVVDSRHSSWAPKSRVLRYRITDPHSRDNKRVFKMMYPTRFGVPRGGTPLLMLAPMDRPDRAIVAELYLPTLRAGTPLLPRGVEPSSSQASASPQASSASPGLSSPAASPSESAAPPRQASS